VADRQEVPTRASEDRTGEQHLAIRHHRQRKKRDQVDGEPRQKFAAFRGRFTRRAVPAMRKGHVRRGPGNRCCRSNIGRRSKASCAGKRGTAQNDVEQGTPEGRTCERRSRTQPRRDCGRKDRGMKQRPHLGRGKTFNEALGQTFRLEVMELNIKAIVHRPYWVILS
jgi:hypothetical protein